MSRYFNDILPNQDFLEHHGILGMHWGKKNGPPYPLDAGSHSSSEKKAGWRKSLDSDSEVSKKQIKTQIKANKAYMKNTEIKYFPNNFQYISGNYKYRRQDIKGRDGKKMGRFHSYQIPVNEQKRIYEKYIVDMKKKVPVGYIETLKISKDGKDSEHISYRYDFNVNDIKKINKKEAERQKIYEEYRNITKQLQKSQSKIDKILNNKTLRLMAWGANQGLEYEVARHIYNKRNAK